MTTWSASRGMRSISVGPRTATTLARTSNPVSAPSKADRQPRVNPTAQMIVTASTISTAEARNEVSTRSEVLMASFLPHTGVGHPP